MFKHKADLDALYFLRVVKYVMRSYGEVTKSEKAKFLTVSIVVFRDNRQALDDIFRYVLTITNPPQSRITITEENYHGVVTQ